MRSRTPVNASVRRSGVVLPLVMFALIILGVIGATAFRTASENRLSARATREYTLALYAAESGMRKTLGNWPTASVAALNAGDSLDLGWQTLPNRASYRAVIHRMDRGGLQVYVLMVRGRGRGTVAGQQLLTRTVSGVPVFKWGVFTQNGISMTGNNGLSDSFDSNSAPYNAATADSSGSLASNGSITLHASTVVKGDLTSTSTITGGIVSGTVTPSAPAFPTMPTLACPTSYTPNSSIPGGTGITYSAVTGALAVAGGQTLTLNTPPTQYYFSSVTLSGNSILRINATQHVDIIVSGVLSVAGGAISNPTGNASKLGISACGNPVAPAAWTLAGGSDAYFSIYAPDRPITLSGNGDLFGAIIGKSLTSSGGAKVHFDASLLDTKAQTLLMVNGTWAQIP